MKRLFLLGIFSVGLAGCNLLPPPQSDPTRYFVLSGATPQAGAAQVPLGTIRLGLRAVDVPGYLHSRELVVREGSSELRMQDYARWAETLSSGIGRVLRSQLESDPVVGRVDSAPFPFDADRDYDVAVEVLRCEGGVNARGQPVARFAAVFQITTAGANPRVIARRTFVAPEVPWNGRNFAELAEGLSQAVQGLGRAIVAALPPSGP